MVPGIVSPLGRRNLLRMAAASTDWSTDVFRAMQARSIATVCTVPDGGLTRLLGMVDADGAMRLVTLSTEPEGIGVATGVWLGGGRALLAMQSSGVGNCLNALGLPTALRAPCLMLVTMRGQWGEFNPWQVPMGQAVRPALEAVGVKCFPVDKAEEVGETFEAAADLAFHGRLGAAVLVGQRIIGAKGFGQK
jgi:sulfopyruvate decarboxylase alpha subunit